METFALLLQGMATSFELLNLGLLIFGCLIGLFVGAMPGLGSVNGVAILIPITFIDIDHFIIPNEFILIGLLILSIGLPLNFLPIEYYLHDKKYLD